MNINALVRPDRPRNAAQIIRTQVRIFKRALKRFTDTLWQRIMVSLTSCCVNSGVLDGVAPYQRLKRTKSDASSADVESRGGTPPPIVLTPPSMTEPEFAIDDEGPTGATASALDDQEDTVVLKVSILGDSETGKTSFMAKYLSVDKTEEYVETIGVASVEKVFRVQNANIAFSIWDLGGHWQCASMLPMVCRDSAAILIMFDLTRRSTLHSVKAWFLQARACNKTALPVIIGTKYDHFVEMPRDIQLAIIQQARFYAQAMGASLFFSSVTHNINIHKIFKVIVAKLFDLPCNISRNLNFGEPIIDY